MIVKGGFVHVAFALIKRITIKFDTFFCLPFVMQYFHIILIPVHLYTQEG